MKDQEPAVERPKPLQFHEWRKRYRAEERADREREEAYAENERITQAKADGVINPLRGGAL